MLPVRPVAVRLPRPARRSGRACRRAPGVQSLLLAGAAVLAPVSAISLGAGPPEDPGEDPPRSEPVPAVAVEAEDTARAEGTTGRERKAGASGGAVLGGGFGERPGDFAEYTLDVPEEITPARISVRYARTPPGHGDLGVQIDGERVGVLRYESTGAGAGEKGAFEWAHLRVPRVSSGTRRLRFTVLETRTRDDFDLSGLVPPPGGVLGRVGGRHDRNSAGHGRQLAVYTGQPARFYYATHELGPVFSAADGATLLWYPDRVAVSPQAGGSERPEVQLDRVIVSLAPAPLGDAPPPPRRSPVIERREVAVTSKDVVLSRIELRNPGEESVVHEVEVTGDCTRSRGWRGTSGGEKATRKVGDFVLLVDRNVFPGLLDGLVLAIGGDRPPDLLTTRSAGTYRMVHRIEVPPGERRELVLGCAVDPDPEAAQRHLVEALAREEPLRANRRAWRRYFREEVPRFRCSDAGLEELWGLRWYLLRFSTCGGDLGHFRTPVVLEGRSAYRTYCCFSAPFLAFDLAWAADPAWGHGQVASLVAAAYEDGRLPWYTAPDTNRVPIHHRSGTGLSLLPLAAWKHWLVHGRDELLAEVYPGLARNVEWWLEERDPDDDGLVVIHHQLETGMDDLLRWPDPRLRYDSVDATSYLQANLEALAGMARALGKESDARRWERRARRTASAVNEALWDEASGSWRDRHPETGELTRRLGIPAFYPFFAGIGGEEHLRVFREHLLDPEEFWTPHPVPSLARSDPDFRRRGFWRGPSWPAATCHVVEAFAGAAREHDRSLLPRAAELLRRAAGNHLGPRADFHERYDPIDGTPLSSFRDYMHSWWIDLIVRHAAGLLLRAGGPPEIDPLPLGLEWFALERAPWRGRSIDVLWERTGEREGAETGRGLTVRVDGEVRLRRPDFVPGDEPVRLPED